LSSKDLIGKLGEGESSNKKSRKIHRKEGKREADHHIPEVPIKKKGIGADAEKEKGYGENTRERTTL